MEDLFSSNEKPARARGPWFVGFLAVLSVLLTAGVIFFGAFHQDPPTAGGVPLEMVAPLPGDKVEVAPGPVQEPTKNSFSVPSLNIAAPLDVTGDDGTGSLVIPADASRVTRYDASAPLGSDEGVTLISGHVTNGAVKGALFPLAGIEVGAEVSLFDDEGEQFDWVVTSVDAYDPDDLPSDIFTRSGERRLAIVTCGGDITIDSSGRRAYAKNVVVIAVPA